MPFFEADEVSRPPSLEERARAKIVFDSILANLKKKSAGSGVEWAQRIMDQAACGVRVEPIRIEMAARALGRDGRGDPENVLEAARERAAIQCEHLPL